jgi:hypothetical protein
MNTLMTPRWCLLYRIIYDDGHSANCSGRSWDETAKAAENDLRETVTATLGPHGSIGFEFVAVLPWTTAHFTQETDELFAEHAGNNTRVTADR